MGKSAFNPPSLRGIGQAVSFFHDGRTASLEEVFTRHHHQVPSDMPRDELDDLLAFQNPDGSFRHSLDGDERNQMSAEQGLYALVAIRRAMLGESGVFDMRDLTQ